MAVQLSFKHLKKDCHNTPYDLLMPIESLDNPKNKVLIIKYSDGSIGAFDSFRVEDGKVYNSTTFDLGFRYEIAGKILGYLDFNKDES